MAEATINKPAPKSRPKHLDLVRIRFPLPSIVSILHRVSGAGLFLLLPFLLCLLDKSLDDASYGHFVECASHPLVKFLLLGLLWAYLHHFCAGIRFLLLDAHKGLDLPCARKSSYAVLAVSLALTAVIGVKLW
ncbi:MAG: succinate dehydrogenase, cytochrome b556 subunit [Azoarcus sp.]|jgi:succinate dehydrogenase / fumarate reductase cytochrome b subunit|nr:succinate dehydrogenase, cytochrome b556 subunit [Azoarcus sp.]